MKRYGNLVHTRIDDDTKRRLGQLAHERGMSESELIRDLLDRGTRRVQETPLMTPESERLLREIYDLKGLAVMLAREVSKQGGKTDDYVRNLAAQASAWAEPKAERAIAETTTKLRARKRAAVGA